MRWQALKSCFLKPTSGQSLQGLLALSVGCMAAGGFGNAYLYAAAGLSLCLALALLRPGRAWLPAAFAGLVALLPECGALTSAWALLLAGQGEKRHGAALLGSQSPWLLAPVLPFPIGFFSPLCTLALYLLLLAGLCILRRRGADVLFVLYAAALLFNTWGMPCRFAATPPDMEVGYGFRVGESLERCLGRPLQQDAILCYDRREESPIPAAVPIYLDHDAWTQYDDANLSQNRPWRANFVYSGERIRFALCRDGVLLFNLGAKLRDDTGCCLYALYQGGRLYTLAARLHGCVLLNDADYVTNSGVPYQENLIRSLAGGAPAERALFTLLALALLCVPTSAGRLRRPSAAVAAALVPAALALHVTMRENAEGEVRYVGRRHYWMHTTLGEGLVRQLQQAGVQARFGNKNATYLVIGQGCSAEWKGEPVVVLEPCATLSACGVSYTAGSLPMGDENGVPDAREIIRSPDSDAAPDVGKLEAENMTIYATGSPCALPLQKP